MANYANAKATIAANIYTNHLGKVTAEMVKTAADAIVDTLIAGGYLYAGVAKLTPTQTNPGSPDANVFYIATEPGTYTNFVGADGSFVVAEGEVAIFKYNGQWSKETTGAATAAQVNQLGQENASNTTNLGRIVWLGRGYSVSTGTGEVQYNSGASRNTTELLKIEDAGIVYSATTPKFYIFFYDGEKNYISATGWKTLVANSSYAFADAPTGAVYFRLMIDTDVQIEDSVSMGKTSGELLSQGDVIDFLSAAVLGNKPLFQWRKKGIGLNTAIGDYAYTANANRYATERYELSKIDAISFLGVAASYYVCFYDSSDNFIESKGWKTGLVYDFDDAPATATYFRIMINSSVCSPSEVIPFRSDLYTDIKRLLDSVYGTPVQIVWTGLSMNTATGDYGSATETRNSTERMILSDIAKLTFSGDTARYYICFYTSADVFISSAGWKTDLVYDFSDAPANSFYVRLLIDTTQCATTEVGVILSDGGLVQDVAELSAIKKSFKSILVVAADGSGDYATIEDALAHAGDSNNNHVTIFVKPGTYYPAPKTSSTPPYVESNRNLSIIGLDRDACILRGDVGYYDIRATPVIDYSLLRLNGNVLVKNLTFINTCERYTEVATEEGWDLTEPHARAYCYHADRGREAGDITAIENCKMYNDHFTCIGFGLRKNSTLRIKDCELESDVSQATDLLSDFSNYGVLYGHLAATDYTAVNQRLEVIDCRIRNKNHTMGVDMKIGIHDVSDWSDISSKLLLSRNTIRTTNQQYAFVNATVSGQPQVNEIDDMSFGNNVESMNYSD